jgi:hypothetical protein
MPRCGETDADRDHFADAGKMIFEIVSRGLREIFARLTVPSNLRR